ncbi:uncharacterized protein LOC6561324 [Drosophila grimshawi]|uniref:GH20652 n=1 Tax=Drosophila grimshawi TaxID=7222 RepID=B4J7F2_DROGR|nr:uncharacterized protein LOC6561324 [Drosophila grimshawi]EDW01076.1 GH20652 [Drosophila grimshawi]
MLQLKIFALFCGLFAVIAFQDGVAQADESEPVEECPDDEGDRDGNDTLCDNFQALRETIDKNTLMDLIQSHYQCDSKFRKAMCYYNTTHFQIVAQQLQQSDGYHLMLEELRSGGVDTSDIENIVDIISCVTVPPPLPDKNCDCKQLKGHTFMGDLLAAMPHQAVHEYTAKSRSRKSNFALFVDIVNSPEFQSHMRTNMMKRDVVRPMRVLRRNGWDLPQLLRGVMTILSW